MDHDNRIPSLTITHTLPRQTPRSDFGTALARTAQEAVRVGAGLVGGMIPAGPIASAAVSSAHAVVSAVAPVSSSSTTVPSTGGVGGSGSVTGSGDAWDLLEAQKALAADGQKFNVAYLQLQDSLQRESREHNAISNIMKVRHDSAKAAINNIR